MDVVVFEIAIIVASIAPVELSFPVLLAVLVEALIASAIRP